MNQPTHVESWKLVLIGFAAGTVGGGLGLGGGLVMVPLLVLVGLQRHRAHATSLAAIIFISSAGAISFATSGEVDIFAGVLIGIGGIGGSIVGASVMHRMSPRGLTIVFGLILLAGGLRMILGAQPVSAATGLAMPVQGGIALVIGLVAGFFAGLAGVGGGVVIVPSSVLFLGLDQHQAQGTSLTAIFLTAVAGTMVNMRNKRVRLIDGLSVGGGGVVGSLLGTRLALAMTEQTLSVVFGCLVLFVALRSLYQTLRPCNV